jgi:probable phosphoglycerate mutase
MSKLYLVRHAEPDGAGLLLGRTDPPLSDAGRRHALAALAGLQVAVVYSSPLRRAMETARAIAAPLVVFEELAEISLGEWDGLSWSEIETRYSELARRKLRHWLKVTPPEGEDWRCFEARVRRALDRIRGGDFPAAVVSHVAVNSVITSQLAGVDPARFRQEHCQVLEYELEPETGTEAAD